MKDLKSKVLELGASSTLTRNQLKNVTGGSTAACLTLGTPCTSFVDCCSGACISLSGNPSEKVCWILE